MNKTKRIPTAVYLLGAVSFFNDIASEMLYPIMPIFLTQVLGAPVFAIGIIEGVAEGTSALFKAYFGILSDKLQKRKPFVVAGYAASAVSKVLIALATTWPLVFFGRFIDRLGKGVRTGARDALLLEAADADNKGLIFGLHRTMDSAGAVIGPLLALWLLQAFSNNIRLIFYIAAIPSFFSLLFFFFIRESNKHVEVMKGKPTFRFSLAGLSAPFKRFLLVTALFSLGNSADSFLILQAKQIGLALTAVVLAYVVYNLVYTLLSTPAGLLADKLGAHYIFPIGLVIYSLVYVGFAFNTQPQLVWLLFATYGAYIALTDGVSKALIGAWITSAEAGAAYGVTQTVTSVMTLLASLIGGALWSLFGAQATFLFGAGCALLALLLYLPFLMKQAGTIRQA